MKSKFLKINQKSILYPIGIVDNILFDLILLGGDMSFIFSVEELGAIDMLRQQSVFSIQQRIKQLTRVAAFEALPQDQAKELKIAKLAFDIAGPADGELSKAAHAAIIERRNEAWLKNKVTH
jgi:hypothetical protein